MGAIQRLGTGNFMQVQSNEQYQEQLDTEKADKLEQEKQMEAPVLELAAHCRREWQVARDAKRVPEEEMLESMRQRKGEYSAQKLQQIRSFGGSEIYMKLTSIKCRAAEAWLSDMMGSDRPYSVTPSPIPDLPPEIIERIQQYAQKHVDSTGELDEAGIVIPKTQEDMHKTVKEFKEIFIRELKRESARRADIAEDAIDDILLEGGWYDELEGFVSDMVTLKAGIMKGPVIKMEEKLTWGPGFKPVVKIVPKRKYYAVSPFNLYPSPNSKCPDSGFISERINFEKSMLYNIAVAVESGEARMSGYNPNAIRRVLENDISGDLENWLWIDSELRHLEGRERADLRDTPDGTIDGIEHHTTVKGQMLIDWGMSTEQIKDSSKQYQAKVVFIGNEVIFAKLNDHPLGKRPYSVRSMDIIRGSFWGIGVPEIIKDLQGMCNACARALSNNMGMSSGPMAEVHKDRLAEGEDATKWYPGRIFQTKSSKSSGAGSKAINFFQVSSNSNELMSVYKYFSSLADQYSGIPSYAYGESDVSGAGATASGLSMLMNSAGRGIKKILASVDKMVERVTKETYVDLLVWGPLDNIAKGDFEIKAQGAKSLIVKEQQQLRRKEFLQATVNEVDLKILGLPGRAQLLRDALKAYEIDGDEIIPTRDEMENMMRKEQEQAQAQAELEQQAQQQALGKQQQEQQANAQAMQNV